MCKAKTWLEHKSEVKCGFISSHLNDKCYVTYINEKTSSRIQYFKMFQLHIHRKESKHHREKKKSQSFEVRE